MDRPYAQNSRGVGIADMACALRSGRPMRAAGEMACHVLDLMAAINDSSAAGRHINVQSTCQQPAALRAGLAAGEIE